MQDPGSIVGHNAIPVVQARHNNRNTWKSLLFTKGLCLTRLKPEEVGQRIRISVK